MSRYWFSLAAILALSWILSAAGRVLGFPGDLDTSFGVGGIASYDSGGDDLATSVIVDRNARIVVAGAFGCCERESDVGIVRYESDGSLDRAFGQLGAVRTDIAGDFDIAAAIVEQPDGALVTAGLTLDALQQRRSTIGLARYTTNGALDSTFGDGGVLETSFGRTDSAVTLALEPATGRILVGGFSDDAVTRVGSSVLVRYNPDGTIDGSFGSSGRAATTLPGYRAHFLSTIAFAADGKIVAGGTALRNNTYEWAIFRYTTDGVLDETFGNGGVVTSVVADGNGELRDLVIAPDGKIVAVGDTFNHNDLLGRITRYLEDGTPDPTFGMDGTVLDAIGGSAAFPPLVFFQSVALQPAGRITIAGSTILDDEFVFTIVRYRGDGSRDLGFGDDGVVVTDVGSSSDTGSSLAIQPDGRLVVAGTSSDGVNNDYSTARYDGSVCGDSIVEWGEECDDGNTIDDDGCSSACLLNRPPSCAHAFASISRLWPPTGRMADVAIRGVTDPDGDPIAITISGVTQDEPVHAGGDHSCPDAAGVGTSVAQLRSERQGNGDGRVYHVSFRANDSRRGICTGILSVCVPHDQGKGSRCVDEGAVTDSAMGCSTARRSG